MSDSEIKKILEDLAQRYDCKIWLAKRIGKRLAYIDGMKAGKEKFLPAKELYEDRGIVILSEGLDKMDQKLFQTFKKVVDCLAADKKVDAKTRFSEI